MRFALVLAAVVASTSVARADVTPTERAVARELFVQGRKLMQSKRYAEACAKLGESQRLDPAPGTLLNLAVCHEAEGKTATAWSELADALSLARRDRRMDRVSLAERHLKQLEPRLSRLTIEVPAAARIAGLEVKLDGGSVGEPSWGTAVPVDPGQHVVEVSAPGKKPWRTELSLGADADRKTVAVPELESLPKAKPKPSPPPKPPESGRWRRPAGLAIGGVGVVALGIGGYFGLRAFSRWEDRNDHCGGAGCDPTGMEAGDDADRAATVANIGIGIGLVGIAAGTYLVLSSASGERSSVAGVRPTADGRGVELGYRKAF